MTAAQAAKQTNRRRPTETIAVLGAGGTMGFPIARNIARAGLPTRVWNRSSEKARPLTADGAYLARTPEDAASGAGIVMTMLADEEAVIRAMDGPDGALRAMRSANQPGSNQASARESGSREHSGSEHSGNEHSGSEDRRPRNALWVQMSTIGEAATERCAELASRNGVGFVDAPVLGTRQPAEEGKLVVLESGPEEARARLQPIFDAIGQRTIRAGEAGAGSRLKLVTNSWVLAVVEAAAETIALAEGLDLDPDLFLRAVEGGALDLPYLRLKSKAMMERDFTPAFRLAHASKDASLVRRAAREHGLDLPLVEAIADRFAMAAKEHGDKDFSATYLTSTPRQD
jgi:3-hydroxyisobutyrate dehydrogenase